MQDVEMLEIQSKERLRNLPQLTIDSFLDKVESKKTEMDTLFSSCSKLNEAKAALKAFIVSHLTGITDNCFAVPVHYSKNKDVQKVFLFVGTHWEVIECQQYKDFIRDAARKMGLDDIFCDDDEFMGKVFNRFVFTISHSRSLQVPAGQMWINLMNGTLEIMMKDGRVNFRPHRKEDFFTYVLPYPYDPAAQCPLWFKFLDRVLPEPQIQLLLGEYIGYCFTKDLKLEKMAAFYGTGANGKSVTLDVIGALFGNCNVSNVSLSALTTDPEKCLMFENKLANISSETGSNYDVAVLKQIVSGEPIVGRELYVGPRTVTNYGKLFTSFNILPNPEASFGFYRRWLFFPFDVTIPAEEQDVHLVDKLCKELPGILNWVLAALHGLFLRSSFTDSQASDMALQEYRQNSNSVYTFFYEKCEIDDSCKTKYSDIYSAYLRFCNAEGDYVPFKKKNFGTYFRSLNPTETVLHHVSYFNVKVNEEI